MCPSAGPGQIYEIGQYPCMTDMGPAWAPNKNNSSKPLYKHSIVKRVLVFKR